MKWKVTSPLVIYSGLSTTQPTHAKVPLSEADMLVNPGVGSTVGGVVPPPDPLPVDHSRVITTLSMYARFVDVAIFTVEEAVAAVNVRVNVLNVPAAPRELFEMVCVWLPQVTTILPESLPYLQASICTVNADDRSSDLVVI